MSSPLPLDGLLVVSLEQAVAAPYVSCRLADAGARVIKIERAEGDFARRYDSVVNGESAYFVWLNRGKESLVLDIKNPSDKVLLERIIARADIFIQNLAPGAASRAGFDSLELRKRHPRLITCDISGYGETGQYSQRKAYDLLVQAETGLSAITGGPAEPSRVGVSVCDIAAGMHAMMGITQALYQREKTGRGSGLKVSLFDGMADWMSVPLLHQEYGGQAPERVGLNHPSIAPYGAYSAGDGLQVVLSIQNEREWYSFCDVVLQSPALASHELFASNELRVKHRPVLNQEIDSVFHSLTRPALVARLEAASVAFGLLNSVEDLLRHPQLRRVQVESGTGPVNEVASPIQWADDQGGIRPDHWGPIPAVGEHNEPLRKEFGDPTDNEH
ncbi:MAG: CaiB/BaiF CoA-transferase family protein [Ketobacteraceae bacterium]|nr:CaiB/BaiF CoA-transferase family protein [Ketobacteraceae bacterium]